MSICNCDKMYHILICFWGFPGGSVVKNPPTNAGDACMIPEWGRSPGEEMATHSSILAWKIPWTEESGRLQSIGWQRVGYDLATKQQWQKYAFT